MVLAVGSGYRHVSSTGTVEGPGVYPNVRVRVTTATTSGVKRTT